MSLSEPIPATEADAPEIARFFMAILEDANSMRSIMYGDMDPDEQQAYYEAIFAKDIARPSNRYLVIKDLSNGQVASMVNWQGPYPATARAAELQKLRAERPPFPAGGNQAALREFQEKIAGLQARVLGESRRDCWLCANVATHPSYQRRGAASALMRWPFERADRETLPVYLETNAAGPAVSLYKKLGFVETGDRLEIDKGKYGGEGMHYHIAMIREPQGSEV